MVTEHNAEINAGFIVVFASSHVAPVEEHEWRAIADATQSSADVSVLQVQADRLEQLYWASVVEFLRTRKSIDDMSAQECASWVQTGLALAPFAGCVTRHSCDWTIAGP